MANSENVVNQLLGAIDTVIGKRLEQLSYDKTIICTIIDDSKAKNGEYRVTDGSVKFWAKCENANYRNDEQVRVSVPNGDTTQEKFIIGKYIKDSSNTPITYMTPLSSVLKMSGDVCDTGDANVYGLQANGANGKNPVRTGTLLWTADITEDTSAMLSSQIYDIIYIQADFKTLLSNYSITSGSYGLILSLGTVLSDGVTPGPNVTCVFDSTQMLGNPYAFGIYTTQAAKFDITNVGKLSSIQLAFYQDGNFMHNTETIEPKPIETPTGVNNILVKNVKIGFGADVINVADETVRLFTTDDLRYDNDNTTDLGNEKTLRLAWYNKDENGQYIGFDDGLDNDGKIKFINEDQYLIEAGENAKLKAQQNYDIPMDKNGLNLAYETKQIRDTLLSVSKVLSTDLHTLIQDFLARFDIAQHKADLKALDDLVYEQTIIIDGKSTTLTNAANECYDWYITALNKAAPLYNAALVPTQVEGSWTFKGDGKAPTTQPNYLSGFNDFFDGIVTAFNITYLPKLYKTVTETHTGYKGIYDDYSRRIKKVLDDLLVKKDSALTLLNGNTAEVMAYFGTYSFTPWTEKDTSAYDGGYSVYWYRYNPDSNGDNFMPRGWQRVATATKDNNQHLEYKVTLDAANMTEEEFKALIIYNHEKYESNTLTFKNMSPVVNSATALLSDHISISHGPNSQETYQNYSMSNTLMNGADRYKKRELKVSFARSDGTPADADLVNAQIYWYLPLNATMLDYDINDLTSLNGVNDFVHDRYSTTQSDMHKDGYVCFYKTIGYGLSADDITNKRYVNDLSFCYRIKNYYTPTAANNTILCTVVIGENKYDAEILMTFASYGTSGTDYTLMVAPIGRQAAITASNDATNPWRLAINLFDNKNEEIGIPGVKVSQRLLTSSKYTANITVEDSKYYCDIYIKDDPEDELLLCDILEFKVSGIPHGESGKTVDLTTFYPVPYTSNSDYYIEGASTVVYDSSGGNPSYFKDPFQVFGQNSAGSSEGTWNIFYAPEEPDNDIKAYLPVLSSNNALLPANMWVENGDVSYNEDKTVKHKYCPYAQYSVGGTVVWSQPILIIQNRYPSPMLNAWDGEFKIDDKNGTIMSTMVSAGRKTPKNTFEGVVMGDIQGVSNSDNKSGLGIYGFNDGAQSFGLNIDGTAFFGKSGRGRILIDGNSGTISSASYQQNRGDTKETNTAGMMIDLDDGFIDMKGTAKINDTTYASNGTQSQIHLDVKSPYFYIKSKDGKELIHIGDEGDDLTPNYFLQTNDYRASTLWSGETFNTEGTPGVGMKIDLAQGKIDAYKFNIKGENDNGAYIALSNDPASFLRIKYRAPDSDDIVDVDVIDVGTDIYQLHSFDWLSGEQGTEIDFTNGRWVSYCNVSGDYNGKAIIINANDNTYPLAIGGSGGPDSAAEGAAFRVAWDGSLNVANNKFNIGADGSLSIGTGALYIDPEGNLYIGYTDNNPQNGIKDTSETASFQINNLGQINVQGRNFEVTPSGRLSLGSDNFVVDEAGNLTIAGEYNNKKELISYAFQVSSSGQLTIANNGSSSIFKITPDGVLTVKETDEDTYAFKVDAEGNLSLGSGIFKVDSSGNLQLGEKEEDGSKFSVFFVSNKGELSINNGRFSVNENGCLTVQPDKNDASKVFRISDNGNLLLGSLNWDEAAFKVSNAGIMTSTGATINNATVTGTLTVNSQFLMTKATDKFEVKSTDIFIGESSSGSNIHINGNTAIGASSPTSSAAKNYRLYIDGKVGIGGETTISGSTSVTGNLITTNGTVTLGGNTSVSGNLSFSGGVSSYVSSLDAKDPYDAGTFPLNQYHSGIDGKIRITMEESGFWWWEGATEAYLIFAKGILVGIEKI